MSLPPQPTRLVGFIEMETSNPPPARWESLIDGASRDEARRRDGSPTPARGRCRTTRILADITRLCDELQAEYEQARKAADSD